MSFMNSGLKFVSRPSEPNKFSPRTWLADGIRRAVNDGAVEAHDRFVSLEDYNRLVTVSEIVALEMVLVAYRRGFAAGFSLAGSLAIAGVLILIFI